VKLSGKIAIVTGTSPNIGGGIAQGLADEGATGFVEVGPGRVLSGLVKRIVDGGTGWSVEDPAGLDKALAALGSAA